MLYPTISALNLLDDVFNDFMFPDVFSQRHFTRPSRPVMRTDIKETENAYQLAIDLPGYKKEDVKASLKDGYLTVTAETQADNDEKDDEGHYIRRERYAGAISRSYYVGDDVTDADIKARFENGILNIDVPKVMKKLPEEKCITIDG